MVIGLHVGSKNCLVDNVESMPGVKKHLVDNVDGILKNKRINLYFFLTIKPLT